MRHWYLYDYNTSVVASTRTNVAATKTHDNQEVALQEVELLLIRSTHEFERKCLKYIHMCMWH